MHTRIACMFVRVWCVHICVCMCVCVCVCIGVCGACVCVSSEWHCFHNCAHYFVRITLDTHYCPQHARCMMVLSFVLNMSKDPDPGVCSAAVRTLGVFVTYPSLSEVHTYVGTFVNLTKFYNTHFMYEFVLCVCITNLVLTFFLIWNFPFHW